MGTNWAGGERGSVEVQVWISKAYGEVERSFGGGYMLGGLGRGMEWV